MTIAEITLAGSGLAVFFVSVKFDNLMLRWTSIGLVAVAWLLRFAKDSTTGEKQ